MEFDKWIDMINEIPVSELCDEFSIEVRKGSVLCPVHTDRHFGNCRISEKGYYCFACGAKGSKIKLIQDTEKTSFMEACRMIADRFRIPQYRKEAGRTVESIPVTSKQIGYLGLRSSDKVICVREASDIKPEHGDYLEEYLEDGTWVFYTGDTVKVSLFNLYKENKSLFHEIIRGKLKDCLTLYTDLYRCEFWEIFVKSGNRTAAGNIQEMLVDAIETLKPLVPLYNLKIDIPEVKKRIRRHEMEF